MNKKFEDLLSSNLKEFEDNKTVKHLEDDTQITVEDKNLCMEAEKYLELFDYNYQSLKKAKREGMSTKEWLNENLQHCSEDLTSELSEKIGDAFNNLKDNE